MADQSTLLHAVIGAMPVASRVMTVNVDGESDLRRARWSVTGAAGHLGSPVDVDDLALVTTELVANARRHGRPPVTVLVVAIGAGLMVAVHDTGRGHPELRRAGPDAIGGRGLLIVDRLTRSRWGVHRSPDGGKWVWALLGAVPPGVGASP